MKIRIKGNSIRLRLTKTEVKNFCTGGYLEECTPFDNNTFVYALRSKSDAGGLSAEFEHGKITVFIPKSFIRDWSVNDKVGFEGLVHLSSNERLYLLVEKDFQCLDETTEDQSDNYENPNKSCVNE